MAEVLGQAGRRLLRETEQVRKLRFLKKGLADDLLTGRVRVAVPVETAA